jgi:translation elongation factor EF-Ts
MTKMNQTPPHPFAIFAYVHHNRRVGALVTVHCETDFALRCDIVQDFGNRLAMHAAANGGVRPDEPWVFASAKTVNDVIVELETALREKVRIAQVHIQS